MRPKGPCCACLHVSLTSLHHVILHSVGQMCIILIKLKKKLCGLLSLAIQITLRDYLKEYCYRSHASLSADGPGKTGLETSK